MKFTKEMLEKAKSANTAEELAALARAEGIELSAEESAKVFANLCKSGELSDEELDNVSGGCGDPEPDCKWGGAGVWENENDVIYDFETGTRVYVYVTPSKGCKGTITAKKIGHDDYGYFPKYFVRHDDGGVADDWYGQANVAKLL